jgi:predicted metal-binding protein
MDDAGETMAMEMIEKLNEEHDQTFSENVALKKKLEDMEAEYKGVSPLEEKTCGCCKETKRSHWQQTGCYHIKGTRVHEAGCGGEDLATYPDGFDDMEDQRVWKSYDICGHCNATRLLINEMTLRDRMVAWAIKFSKCQNITPRLVQEFKKLKEKADSPSGGANPLVWTKGPWPIYFNDADEDMAWALWRQAMET